MNSNPDMAVQFDQVCVNLGGIEILYSVTAGVPWQSNTAIIGPNGAGKSTLLLALLNQISFRGSILLSPPQGLSRKPKIGYVPQRLSFDRGMPLSVLEFMVMGNQRLPIWLTLRKKKAALAREYLNAVHAGHLESQRIGNLSGGELKRVLLALALQQEPDLLILDEPDAGVDIRGEELCCELLSALRKQKGFTQLMISHDLSMVTAHADHVICLNHTVTGEGAPGDVLVPRILTSTFGIHMGFIDSCFIHREGAPSPHVCREESHG